MKKRVTGIGGIFFKTKDPKGTKEWYNKHLGIQCPDEYGGVFEWQKTSKPEETGFTIWGPFDENTEYFQPSKKDFMFNYRVENLEELLKELKEEGVEIVGEMQVFEYGKFGWILDPEGNKVELWEPFEGPFSEMYKGKSTSE
ncbi:glyoxalase [Marinifilum breve]|uniref:Glyoxalase n=1 Tax=Marinifilum breve TaxID=2184082 RepID=A0A2V4AF60_9BACT|nr:VOC family protein [Marinifilum breve]PXY02734.1 glyoxalase [Marinifilum breve]